MHGVKKAVLQEIAVLRCTVVGSSDESLGTWCRQEEKLEPVKNATDDPRIRLLNRLYARKRKELQEKKCIKVRGLRQCGDRRLFWAGKSGV